MLPIRVSVIRNPGRIEERFTTRGGRGRGEPWAGNPDETHPPSQSRSFWYFGMLRTVISRDPKTVKDPGYRTWHPRHWRWKESCGPRTPSKILFSFLLTLILYLVLVISLSPPDLCSSRDLPFIFFSGPIGLSISRGPEGEDRNNMIIMIDPVTVWL